MKAYRGRWGTAPRIRNIGIRWRRVVNFTLRSLYPWERKQVPTELEAGWALGLVWKCRSEQKSFGPCQDTKSGTSCTWSQSHKIYTQNSDMFHISGKIFSNRHGVTSKNTWICRQKCPFGHWFRYGALNSRWTFNSRSHAIFWHSVIRRQQQNARVSLCSPGRHKRGGRTAPLIPNLHIWTRVMSLSRYRFTLGESGLCPQNRSGCFAKENFRTSRNRTIIP